MVENAKGCQLRENVGVCSRIDHLRVMGSLRGPAEAVRQSGKSETRSGSVTCPNVSYM